MTRMLTQWIALAALVIMALSGCQSGPAAPAVSSGDTTPTLSRNAGEYKLGSGDRLRVTVFGETDLSGEYLVDGAGTVSLPLVGEISAAGLTVREFQRATEQALRNGYLRDPRVSTEVLNFRPYYILGEVNRPGEYPYTEGLTVLNAIATAEGFTYRANQKLVMIKSADSGAEARVDLTPGTQVMPGDTIRVLERFF